MFSALKRGGIPLYELARKGIDVDREPRQVHIESLSLTVASAAEISISVRCSKGTYVRSLACDIAAALGTVGHLASLRRTTFGPRLPRPSRSGASRPKRSFRFSSPRVALSGLREIEIDAQLATRIRRGQQVAVASLLAAPSTIGDCQGASATMSSWLSSGKTKGDGEFSVCSCKGVIENNATDVLLKRPRAPRTTDGCLCDRALKCAVRLRPSGTPFESSHREVARGKQGNQGSQSVSESGERVTG